MDQNTVKSRLQCYLRYKNLTQLSFCNTLGVSTGYIASIRKSISPDKISCIAENYPDLNIAWLMTGAGSMLNDQPSVTNVGSVIANGDNNKQNVVSTPDDTFWKDLVSQLREDIRYWKERCSCAEDQLRKLEELKNN